VPDIGLMRLTLEVAHDAVTTDDTNLPDPGMILADPRIKALKVKREDIIHVLAAIQVTTGMIVIRNATDYQFELLAPVETIVEALGRQASPEETPQGATKAPGREGTR